jgi:hypothetical protein
VSPELDVAADTRSTLLRAGSRRYHPTMEPGEALATAAPDRGGAGRICGVVVEFRSRSLHEGVNDSIIADASTKTVRSFQPMMRKRCEVRTGSINFRFNARAKSWWQLRKTASKLETSVRTTKAVDHSRSRAHASFPSCVTVYPHASLSRVFRLTYTCALSTGHVAFGLLNRAFKLRSEF